MTDQHTPTLEKAIEEYFRDWEGDAFGFGYGSGEDHIIPAVKLFMAAIPTTGTYDYTVLEGAVGPVPAWCFINVLCRGNAIEYGTSPRFGWLKQRGKNLKAFFDARSDDELFEALNAGDTDAHCYPDHCDCDGDVKCVNPFWTDIPLGTEGQDDG